MSTLPQPFRIRFTNNSANSAYVDDLLRINAIIFTSIAYSWRDCCHSLVWFSRSCSAISFNLLGTVSRRHPSRLQIFKGFVEREVLLWNLKVSLSLNYKNSMLRKNFCLLLRLWHFHLFNLFRFFALHGQMVYNCFSLSVHEMASLWKSIVSV